MRRTLADARSPLGRSLLVPAIALVTMIATLPACRDGGSRVRPNILLIVADDFGTNHFDGNVRATPTLDALAREGVRFPSGFVSTARCGPVRSAVNGGVLPRQSGMYFNATPFPYEFDHDNWLAAILQREGYRTFMGGTFPGNPSRASYDVIDAGAEFARTDQDTMIDFLTDSDRPWFAWYGPRLPHIPHDPPEEYLDRIDPDAIPIPDYIEPELVDEYRFRERCLYAMEAWFDDRVREVLTCLRQTGQLDDTLIVFINDNGFQHGLVSKGSPYEAGLRTPVVFYSKRLLPAGEIRSEWIRDIDVFATIMDYARIKDAPPSPGRSIRGLLGTPQGFDPAWPDTRVGLAYPKTASTGVWWRDAYAIHIREGRFKYIRFLRDVRESENEMFGIHHLLTDFPNRDVGDEELFDLETDPFERENRIDDPSLNEIRRRLSGEIDRWTDEHFR